MFSAAVATLTFSEVAKGMIDYGGSGRGMQARGGIVLTTNFGLAPVLIESSATAVTTLFASEETIDDFEITRLADNSIRIVDLRDQSTTPARQAAGTTFVTNIDEIVFFFDDADGNRDLLRTSLDFLADN